MDLAALWVPATLLASAGQVARNATQRRLTETIGTVGATQVRFLYGFPFAVLFLAGVLAATGEALPGPAGAFPAYLLVGSAAQILATSLMLAAMRERSFSVVTALIKTEAIQIALVGFVLLGDRVSPLGLVAILVATAGVAVVSWTPKAAGEFAHSGIRPVLLGVAAGGLFALSAVALRGAILALDSGSFLVRATTTLAWNLGLQTAILIAWLAVFDRSALVGSFRVWRSSLLAGLLGAAASQFWFIGFALTSAANVRTLALVEVVMAQAISRRISVQGTSPREGVGMALIVGGVLLLLLAHR